MAVDRAREGGHRLLGQVLDGLPSDAAGAPAAELALQDGPEGLPEFEPGGVVPGAQAADEVGTEVVHGVHPTVCAVRAEHSQGAWAKPA